MAGIMSAFSGGLKRITFGWILNTILAVLVFRYWFFESLVKIDPDRFANPFKQEKLRRLRRMRAAHEGEGNGNDEVKSGTAMWYVWLASAIVAFIVGTILFFSSTFLLSEPYISWMKGVMGVHTKNLGFNFY